MEQVTGTSEAEPLFWSVTERALLSASLLAIMTFSVLGNSLVIVVVARNRGMRTRTNMFLCSLAVADLLCSVLAMPFSLAIAIRAEWIFSRALCLATGFMTPLFVVASTHTLMYISVHRFVTIRNPLSRAMTQRRVIIMIVSTWALAIVASSVSISGLTQVNHSRYTTHCAPKYPDDAKSYAHMALAMLICYLVPMVVIIVCSVGVLREIRAYGHHLRDSSTVDENDVYEQQKHIAVTLILVVVAFIVCWTPLVVYAIYSTLVRDEERIHHLANPVCWWFGYLNSACNPVIYAFRSEAFREGYRQVICRSGKPRRGSTSTESSMRDRFSRLIQHDSSLSSNVFNASVSVPTTPGGRTYLSSAGHDDAASSTALMPVHAGQSSAAQRSVSDRRPARPRQPPVDVSSDLIEMDSFRWKGTDDEDDDEDRRRVQRGGQAGVSFSDNELDRADAEARRERPQRARKLSLMRLPSLEHLDRTADGKPWRRRRRKRSGGIGGLHPALDEPTGGEFYDDAELDRVTDVEVNPVTTRKPARSGSGVSRTASVAAKKQLLANRGAQQPAEPDNRIYRPIQKAKPLPATVAPPPPAAVDRGELRVAGEQSVEAAESRPRRQRRRRPREAPSENAIEPAAAPAAPGPDEPRVHRPHNGTGNAIHDSATEVARKPEPEVDRGGHRHPSRRSSHARRTGRTDARTESFV